MCNLFFACLQIVDSPAERLVPYRRSGPNGRSNMARSNRSEMGVESGIGMIPRLLTRIISSRPITTTPTPQKVEFSDPVVPLVFLRKWCLQRRERRVFGADFGRVEGQFDQTRWVCELQCSI
jgi:hypothetical protein